MSTYDKTERLGYDATDRELNAALESLHTHHPKVARAVQQRVHEGILQRLKEMGTQKCYKLLEDLQSCMNNHGLTADLGLRRCAPQRDTVNECYRSVHTEENYQQLRLQMLRGELLQQHAEKTVRRVELYKQHSPETISNWKPDYAWRYKRLADRLGSSDMEPEDLAFKGMSDDGSGSVAGSAPQPQATMNMDMLSRQDQDLARSMGFKGFSDGMGGFEMPNAASAASKSNNSNNTSSSSSNSAYATQPQQAQPQPQPQTPQQQAAAAAALYNMQQQQASQQPFMPSTAKPGARQLGPQDALDLLHKQNEQTQRYRLRKTSLLLPQPPEFGEGMGGTPAYMTAEEIEAERKRVERLT